MEYLLVDDHVLTGVSERVGMLRSISSVSWGSVRSRGSLEYVKSRKCARLSSRCYQPLTLPPG